MSSTFWDTVAGKRFTEVLPYQLQQLNENIKKQNELLERQTAILEEIAATAEKKRNRGQER